MVLIYRHTHNSPCAVWVPTGSHCASSSSEPNSKPRSRPPETNKDAAETRWPLLLFCWSFWLDCNRSSSCREVLLLFLVAVAAKDASLLVIFRCRLLSALYIWVSRRTAVRTGRLGRKTRCCRSDDVCRKHGVIIAARRIKLSDSFGWRIGKMRKFYDGERGEKNNMRRNLP